MRGIVGRLSVSQMAAGWRVLGLLLFALLSLVLPIEEDVAAGGPNQAGLVIRSGDGSVQTACVACSEPEISGLDLLSRSGLPVNVEHQGGGFGGAVCKIGGEGCDYPLDDCFCQCVGVDCVYWAYYHLRPDVTWDYSIVGAAGYMVQNGAVEGWSWGPGDYGVSGTKPPAIPFDQICAPPATATNTPAPTMTHTSAPTATPTPVPTRTPTFTVAPTLTPTPAPTLPPTMTHTPTRTPTAGVASIEFWADRTEVVAGQCASLGWRVSGVTGVYLNNQGVIGEEVRQVCPTVDTTYTLKVTTTGEDEQRQIFIRAIQPTTTATYSPTPAPTAIRRAAATVVAPALTAPATPQPTVAPAFTWTPVPTLSPATNTPAAVAVLAATSTLEPTATPSQTAPPTETRVPATVVAILAPPTATPQVWAYARGESDVSRSLIPTSAPARTEREMAALHVSPAEAGYRLLLDYGLFFLMAALLVAIAIWMIRQHSGEASRL